MCLAAVCASRDKLFGNTVFTRHRKQGIIPLCHAARNFSVFCCYVPYAAKSYIVHSCYCFLNLGVQLNYSTVDDFMF